LDFLEAVATTAVIYIEGGERTRLIRPRTADDLPKEVVSKLVSRSGR
jgi:hypothetical protein